MKSLTVQIYEGIAQMNECMDIINWHHIQKQWIEIKGRFFNNFLLFFCIIYGFIFQKICFMINLLKILINGLTI